MIYSSRDTDSWSLKTSLQNSSDNPQRSLQCWEDATESQRISILAKDDSRHPVDGAQLYSVSDLLQEPTERNSNVTWASKRAFGEDRSWLLWVRIYQPSPDCWLLQLVSNHQENEGHHDQCHNWCDETSLQWVQYKETVMSDKEPQFSSKQFKAFWDIVISISQSNYLVSRARPHTKVIIKLEVWDTLEQAWIRQGHTWVH